MPLTLFKYQEEGANWIATRRRSGLLDTPGLGKSAQIIRAMDLRRMKRGMIICPAHLTSNWLREHSLFACFPRKLIKIRNMHDYVAWTRKIFDVAVMSYEMAVKLAPSIHDESEILDFIAMDEFHYMSNLETKRAKAIIGEKGDGIGGIVQWAVQSWAVTGTLMSNDPSQCFAFLRFSKALELTFPQFQRRYFSVRVTTWGDRNKPKAETLSELQMLITNNSIRRTFEQVGYELPPIFLTTTLVDGDTDQIKKLLAQHPGLDEAILNAINQGGLSFLDNQHVATMRRLIAEAKAIPYAEMLIDELRADPDRKVVVLGIHRLALQMIQDYLAKKHIWAVLVQGGMTERAKTDAVDSFQSNPQCRVFEGNYDAAGTGYTLTASCLVDLFECDWRPAVNHQGIGRVRRISQQRTQHARFITLARSLDEVVNRVVAEKTKAIAMVEGSSMVASPEAAE